MKASSLTFSSLLHPWGWFLCRTQPAVRLEQQRMSDFDSLSRLLSGCAVKCILMGGASVKINRKDSFAL